MESMIDAIVIQELRSAVADTRNRWEIWKVLFCNDYYSELSFKKFPLVSHYIEESLIKSTLQALLALVDPVKTCGKENLTFVQFEHNTNVSLKIQEICQIVHRAKKLRDKVLSHIDKDTAIGVIAAPTVDVNVVEIDRVFSLMFDVLVLLGNKNYEYDGRPVSAGISKYLDVIDNDNDNDIKNPAQQVD